MFILASSFVVITISILSALVAFLSLWISWNVYKIQRARRSEERAASLIAYFSEGKCKRLRIENTGNGEARDILVFLDGRPLEEHHCWVPNQSNKIAILPGHGYGDYVIRLPSSKPIPKLAKIHWVDDVKKDNVSCSPLTL